MKDRIQKILVTKTFLRKIQGFTLLYAIIMVGAVLFITTAGYSLLSRQVRFATLSNDSQDAYYAAESAGECVLSYAQKGIFDKKLVQDIVCDGVTYHTDGTAVQTFPIVVTNPTTNQQTVASVKVDTGTKTIESVGYNSPDATLPTRIQRAITFKYKSYCPIGGDVMLVVDLSGSINSTELTEYKKSLTYFVNSVFAADPTNTRIGLVGFGTQPQLITHLTSNKQTLLNAISNLSIAVNITDGIGRATNSQGGLREALFEFQGRQESSIAWNRSVIPEGTLKDNVPITNPAGGYNRDDETYPNYYILFTDGASNALMPLATTTIEGYTVGPLDYQLDVCDTNPLTAGGCAGAVGQGVTMQNFVDTATAIKNTGGVIYLFGIAVDDASCTQHACSWYLPKIPTKPEFYYPMTTFTSAQIDAATDDLLTCSKN